MRITLSAAVTADGFLDDRTPDRLMISTPEDWTEVRRLRAEHDAILVGAETLRCDDPALLLRDPTARARRVQAGKDADLTRVTLTASGNLDPTLRFFTEGDTRRIVFSAKPLPALAGLSEVVVADGPVSARWIVTELEKRGIGSLFVEGGARTLALFLHEGMADTVRRAVNPQLRAEVQGKVRFDFAPPAGTHCERENLGGMEVSTWTLRPDTTRQDLQYLQLAADEARKCAPSATSYCVGAAIVTTDGRVFKGYTHETSPTHHAEQEAIAKALAAGVSLRGATIYSSMEPCSTRRSEPESCSQLIVRHEFARVVFALYEPDRFVRCRGALLLREAGIDVRVYPQLGEAVRAANAHLEI